MLSRLFGFIWSSIRYFSDPGGKVFKNCRLWNSQNINNSIEIRARNFAPVSIGYFIKHFEIMSVYLFYQSIENNLRNFQISYEKNVPNYLRLLLG